MTALRGIKSNRAEDIYVEVLDTAYEYNHVCENVKINRTENITKKKSSQCSLKRRQFSRNSSSK